MTKRSDCVSIETLLFADDGAVPNNPALPLICYRGALPTDADAAAYEACFARNGWTGSWRNGIYAHHHYHSNAHEVLGIAAGFARVRLGGEPGKVVALSAGDVVVIPAGVAHKCEAASPDLLVVGAYPRGQHPDIRTPHSEHAHSSRAVAAVPLPAADPVSGPAGPLLKHWAAAQG